MGNLVREIRKEVNFSIEEYQQIQNSMEQEGYEQFSMITIQIPSSV